MHRINKVNIYHFYKKSGLTEKLLSELTGIPQNTIHNIIYVKFRVYASTDELNKIIKTLNERTVDGFRISKLVPITIDDIIQKI